jgi:DinB superfamily
MHYQKLIDQYLAGPDIVASAVARMSVDQLNARPIAGTWSTSQVVCHIADFEPIYADRMKRVIAESCPTFFGGDPDTFAAGLAYERRPVGTELELIAAVRRQMATILRELTAGDFERTVSIPRPEYSRWKRCSIASATTFRITSNLLRRSGKRLDYSKLSRQPSAYHAIVLRNSSIA